MQNDPRTLFALVPVVLAGCGPGINGLAAEGEPLITIRAQVAWDEEAFLESVAGRWLWPGEPPPDPGETTMEELGLSLDQLRAAVVWGGRPRDAELCAHGDRLPELAEACSYAGYFVAGLSERAAVVDPNSLEVEVTIDKLPPADVLVGTTGSRLAFASVVTFFDSPEMFDDYGEGFFSSSDVAVGATFTAPSEVDSRIVLREGAFIDDPKFYPLDRACPEPPPGFSHAYRDRSGSCTVGSLSEPLVVPVAAAEPGRLLGCNGYGYFASVFEASDWFDPGLEGEERPGLCIDENTYVVPEPYPCPQLLVYALVGCYGSDVCERPDWDRRDNPPEGWPCKP